MTLSHLQLLFRLDNTERAWPWADREKIIYKWVKAWLIFALPYISSLFIPATQTVGGHYDFVWIEKCVKQAEGGMVDIINYIYFISIKRRVNIVRSVCMSVSLAIVLTVRFTVCLSDSLSVCLFANYIYVCLSAYQSVWLPINLSVCLSVCLYVGLSVCPSVWTPISPRLLELGLPSLVLLCVIIARR